MPEPIVDRRNGMLVNVGCVWRFIEFAVTDVPENTVKDAARPFS
jgi:hypothetical protein